MENNEKNNNDKNNFKFRNDIDFLNEIYFEYDEQNRIFKPYCQKYNRHADNKELIKSSLIPYNLPDFDTICAFLFYFILSSNCFIFPQI